MDTAGEGASGSRSPAGPDYRSIADAFSDMTTVVDGAGRFRFVSPASRRLFGWAQADLEGRPEAEFIHPEDSDSVGIARMAQDPEPAVVAYRFLCRDGSYRWVKATMNAITAQGSALTVSILRNIGQPPPRTSRLERLAITDPLTGVGNRALAMDRLGHGLQRLGRRGGLLCLLYLDLDRFKIVNDTLGHSVGDAVLLTTAERLTHQLRPADTLARMGGDEFVVLAEDMADPAAALELAARIVEAGREPFRVDDMEFVCTLSVGIACAGDDQRSALDLLREADIALYRAKDRGRDRFELFDGATRTGSDGRPAMERMLQRAVHEGRVVTEYQPVIDLRSKAMAGAEALVRIRDGDDALLHPSSFLDLAAESGLLTTIDDRVLADAVTQVAAWRRGGTGPDEVSVNITARRLASAVFCPSVMDLLDNHGVPPHSLQIEVTERVLLGASNSALTTLHNLKAGGVQIGLDDFGTGSSSLAYMRQFPLDFIKIDKSIIDDLETAPLARAMMSAIVSFGHALELTLVAEGVETDSQLDILCDLGCDRAQGFVFSASSPPDQLSISAR